MKNTMKKNMKKNLYIYYVNGIHPILSDDITVFIKADSEKRATYIAEKEVGMQVILCIETNPEKLDDSLLELPDYMGYVITKHCKGNNYENNFIRVYTREEKIDSILD